MNKNVVLLAIVFFFLFQLNSFELEVSRDYINESMIGLSINGSSTTTFPNKESGLAIGSIICDKGANGVWDYDNWTLRIRNITESRTKCQINFVSKYYESILKGTDPVLKDGLIPVTISDDGTVTKASLGSEWYKYQDRRWANAVILNNETEVYYDGDIIPEEAIESYFVWIPRYKYKLFDMGKYEELTNVDYSQVHIIDVIFETETTSNTASECASPRVSGEDGSCSVGKYMTHPAFVSFNTNGMWVGKFETGYKGATTIDEATKNENNASKIQIKPNVYSWRNIRPANAHLSSYSYKREFDSHMMKNTEWGAIAYLQHSKYGSGNVSVRINNHSEYKTGYAAVREPTAGIGIYDDYGTSKDVTQPWNTDIGVLASTTGNISGIYDMSGGVNEYVMGVMLSLDNITPCSGRSEGENSEFNGAYCFTNGSLNNGVSNFPDSKYYDAYRYGKTFIEYYRRILGDATGEMGPFALDSQSTRVGSWYNAVSQIWHSSYPWAVRGNFALSGSNSGIFTFAYDTGTLRTHSGYRIVLSF